MDPFAGANWYSRQRSLESIPVGSIFLVIDRGCGWCQKKSPMFIQFVNSLSRRAPDINTFMIDFADWEFPNIEGFPTLLVKTKTHGFVKIGPSKNFQNDLANALKLALQSKQSK